MPRLLAAASVLILASGIGVAAPVGSGASTVAGVSVAKKCKHRHLHHRKRCRRKAASSPTGSGGSDGGGGTSGSVGRLLVTSREISPTQLQLQLSRPSLRAGSAIVEQYNAGSDPHNLVAERQGTIAFSFNDLDPGGDQRQTLTLARGTYTLYCSLLNHRALGMQATLTVN